jgi:hypothetical protein
LPLCSLTDGYNCSLVYLDTEPQAEAYSSFSCTCKKCVEAFGVHIQDTNW